MKTQYYTAASLDGFIGGPDHSLDWLFQFGDAGMDDIATFMENVGALAMGASTYQWLLDHAVGPAAKNPEPWPYNQTAWVFTHRSLYVPSDADIRFVQGDVTRVHAEMRKAAAGKNIWLVGGGDLVGQFHDAGLLDEIIVAIAPVTLGAGAPLLPRTITTPPLKLVTAKAAGPFAQLRYEVVRRG